MQFYKYQISTDSKYKVDIDDVKVEKKAGGSLRDTTLIQGIVLDKEVVHGGMPKRIEIKQRLHY